MDCIMIRLIRLTKAGKEPDGREGTKSGVFGSGCSRENEHEVDLI